MEPFQLEIVCHAGGTRHTHVIVVERGSGAYGVSRPGTATYACSTHVLALAPVLPAHGRGRAVVDLGARLKWRA